MKESKGRCLEGGDVVQQRLQRRVDIHKADGGTWVEKQGLVKEPE